MCLSAVKKIKHKTTAKHEWKGLLFKEGEVLILEADYGNIHINDKNPKGKKSYIYREELKERDTRIYYTLCFLDSLFPTVCTETKKQ